jgi:hypothetical protein
MQINKQASNRTSDGLVATCSREGKQWEANCAAFLAEVVASTYLYTAWPEATGFCWRFMSISPFQRQSLRSGLERLC